MKRLLPKSITQCLVPCPTFSHQFLLLRFISVKSCTTSPREEVKRRMEEEILKLRQFVKGSKFDEAQTLYVQLKQNWGMPAVITMLETSYRYRKAGAFTQTVKNDVFGNEKLLATSGVLEAIIDGLSLFKKSQEMLEIENWVKTYKPDKLTRLYYYLITAYLRSEEVETAIAFIDKLKHDNSIQFDVYLYAAEMACYVTPLNLARFQVVWSEMQEARVAANRETLDVLLLMLSKSNCTNELIRVLRELPNTYKFQRNQKNFLMAMKHCVSALRFSDALKVFKLLESDRMEIPANCFELGLYSANKVKDFTLGIRLLKKMFSPQKVETIVRVNNNDNNKQAEEVEYFIPEETEVPGMQVAPAVILKFIHNARKSELDELLDPVLKEITERLEEASFLLTESKLQKRIDAQLQRDKQPQPKQYAEMTCN